MQKKIISMHMDYDKRFDVLYCRMGNTGNSYADELDENVILLRDKDADHITGITIVNFKQKYAENPNIANILQRYCDFGLILNVLKMAPVSAVTGFLS